MDGGLALRPWRVWIAGPQGTKLFHSRHESEAEANAVAASLPSHLRPRVEFAPTGFRWATREGSGVMAGFMVPEVWCDRCSLREQSEDEGTLRELRADLRLDRWVRRRTAEG